MARRVTLAFLKTESGGGLVLAAAAALAVLLANSPFAPLYFGFVQSPFTLAFGAFQHTASVGDWAAQGLMAVAFFVIGMEIKYELRRGELSDPRRLALPVAAAAGGVAVPAAMFLAINAGAGGQPQAWLAASATDMSCAAAVLALVSRGLPGSLRAFLLTVVILHGLLFTGLLALMFSERPHPWELMGAGLALGFMALLGRARAAPYVFYAAGFVVVWGFMLKAGIHTAAAGLLAAMTVPASPRRPGQDGVLRHFLRSLHPYVAFGVLPFFAFTAAGFAFADLPRGALTAPVVLGVAAGLCLGKPLGIIGASALAVALGARKPLTATWTELFGAALLCGIGFTMSLFVGALAFPASNMQSQAEIRLGVILASAVSAVAGAAVLAAAARRRARLGLDHPDQA